MRKFFLAAVLVLMAGGAQASSYLQIGGNVVDPIQFYYGGNHTYSGTNLQPNANLSGADLNYALLHYASLSNANLNNAYMPHANLNFADLSGANLSFANLAATSLHANLSYANLAGAILSSANLNEADLTFANLAGADLNGVNLNTATLAGAILSGANLNGAVLLQNVIGIPDYDALTNFTGAWADYNSIPFDPVAAGWNLVPEPNTALLLATGLIGLSLRKRQS